ncbi:hypothetical protein ACFLZC_02235 [Patescibacteria group bacterium]
MTTFFLIATVVNFFASAFSTPVFIWMLSNAGLSIRGFLVTLISVCFLLESFPWFFRFKKLLRSSVVHIISIITSIGWIFVAFLLFDGLFWEGLVFGRGVLAQSSNSAFIVCLLIACVLLFANLYKLVCHITLLNTSFREELIAWSEGKINILE